MTKEQFFGMYLGQNCLVKEVAGKRIIKAKLIGLQIIGGGYSCIFAGSGQPIGNCKLILRPLSSMTEGETVEYIGRCLEDGANNDNSPNPPRFTSIAWAIEHGFNIFENIVPADWYVYEEVKE